MATAAAIPATVLLALPLSRPTPTEPASSPSSPAATALPPLPVAPPPSLPPAAQRSCKDLLSVLPAQVGTRSARPVDSPSAYVAAWGEPPVVLRCGVPRPGAFRAGAHTFGINGVTWFAEERGGTTAFTAVDRPVYVEVTAPADVASEPAALLSAAVAASLPARPLDPAP